MVFKEVKPEERNRFLEVAAVRFTKKGLFFNVTAMRDYFKEVNFVELLFDLESGKVAIKILKKKTRNSFPLRHYRDENSPVGLVSCSSLLRELSGVLGKQKAFCLTRENDLIIIDLKD